jgi:hypothetical protein
MLCCGSLVPIGWPSIGAPTASSSTASGCRPSTSTTGRRSRSVIRSGVLGWFFKSPHPRARRDSRPVRLNAGRIRRLRSRLHPRSLPAGRRFPRSGRPSGCHSPCRNRLGLSDQSRRRRRPRSDRSHHQCHPSDRPRRRPHHRPQRRPHHRRPSRPHYRPHHRRSRRRHHRRQSRPRRASRPRRQHPLPRMRNHRVEA